MYTGMAVAVGNNVELPCNTSLTPESDVMWTYGTDDGYVDYIYWNGRLDAANSRLSIKTTVESFYSLVLDDAQLTDSGLYDCYVGVNRVGYLLNVTGKPLCNSIFQLIQLYMCALCIVYLP